VSAKALLLLAGTLASQGTGPADADVAELTRLEAVWNDAHLRGDTPALDRLWADELVAIVPKMTPLPKQDALAFARSGRMKFLRYESSEIGVRVYGDKRKKFECFDLTLVDFGILGEKFCRLRPDLRPLLVFRRLTE